MLEQDAGLSGRHGLLACILGPWGLPAECRAVSCGFSDGSVWLGHFLGQRGLLKDRPLTWGGLAPQAVHVSSAGAGAPGQSGDGDRASLLGVLPEVEREASPGGLNRGGQLTVPSPRRVRICGVTPGRKPGQVVAFLGGGSTCTGNISSELQTARGKGYRLLFPAQSLAF